MLNYQALYYLIEVSSAQSFTLAAENLHMTRPALSTAIKNLEKDLGFPLLTRSHEGVTLTPQGEAVIELARKGFAFFDEIERLTQNKPLSPFEISCYATQALNPYFMPALVKKFYEQYPDETFNVYSVGELSPDEILLKNPDSFVLGIYNESHPFHESLQTIILDKSKTYLAMGADAPFFPPEVKSISLKDLLQVPLIATQISEEQTFQNELLAALRKYGEPNIRFTSPGMDMSSSLIASNLGATFYPYFKVLKTPGNINYRTVRIKNTPTFILAAIYHKDMPQEKVDFFLSLLNQI